MLYFLAISFYLYFQVLVLTRFGFVHVSLTDFAYLAATVSRQLFYECRGFARLLHVHSIRNRRLHGDLPGLPTSARCPALVPIIDFISDGIWNA